MTRLKNLRWMTVVILFVLALPVCAAESNEIASAKEFSRLYSELCMQNTANYEGLRNNLIEQKIPKLPDDKAKSFLQGIDGDVWPFPDQGKLGNLVAALHASNDYCAIFVRRASIAEMEKQFVKLVTTAPAPFVSTLKKDETITTKDNGKAHTLAYSWVDPKTKEGILFLLTTATAKNAQLQGLASTSFISEQQPAQ